MSTLSIQKFQRAQVLTSISGHRYRLAEYASTYHQHVWTARSEMLANYYQTLISKHGELIDNSDGSQVIIKSPLRADHDEQMRAMRQLNKEMMVLNGPLRNAEGIRQLIDQIVLTDDLDGQTRAGVFEHLEFDLENYYLTQKDQLSCYQIKSIARQILRALSNNHKYNIVHTDLKPENIVFSHHSNLASVDILAKLIDFGVASQPSEDRRYWVTNPYWRSPESWVGLPWGPPTDIWSFGAIIGSLLMEPGAVLFKPIGDLAPASPEEQDREFLRSLWTVIPFPDVFLERVPEKWRNDILKFSPKLTPNGVPVTLSFIGDIFEVQEADWAFVRDILQVDPDKRPTADELLEHSWLSS